MEDGYAMRRRRESVNSAFALIELLVVIAIIAVLAGMLLPPSALKPMQARHAGKTVLLFADGHAGIHAAPAILLQDRGATGAAVRPCTTPLVVRGEPSFC